MRPPCRYRRFMAKSCTVGRPEWQVPRFARARLHFFMDGPSARSAYFSQSVVSYGARLFPKSRLPEEPGGYGTAARFPRARYHDRSGARGGRSGVHQHLRFYPTGRGRVGPDRGADGRRSRRSEGAAGVGRGRLPARPLRCDRTVPRTAGSGSMAAHGRYRHLAASRGRRTEARGSRAGTPAQHGTFLRMA